MSKLPGYFDLPRAYEWNMVYMVKNVREFYGAYDDK